jgi:predicted PurR-regulated permease PerM
MHFDLARLILAIVAIVGLVAGSMWIMSPFFTSIVWATMIVVACWPLMLHVQSWARGRRSPAVVVMTLLMLAVFIVPLLLAINTIVDNADTLVRWGRMAAHFELPPPPAWVASLPLVGERVAEIWAGLRAAGADDLVKRAAPYAGRGAQWVAGQAGGIGLLLVHFLATVVIATVMFAQGEEGARRVLALARRISEDHGEDSLRLAAAAIRGVALGVVVTALLQTIATALGLYIAGVPFAGLLTAVTLILCIAQIGAGLVLIPAVIWLFVSGDTGFGVFLAIWSVLVLTMDNFIRPFLIRKGADLPLLLIFAGVIGGLLSMGLVGLFIGPVILAVTYRLFEAWAGLYVVPTPQSPAAPPAAAPPPAAPATALAADQVASQAPEAVVAAPAPAGTVPTSDPPR